MQIPNNLSEIAKLIREDWQDVIYTAKPYLAAMETLNSIDDHFFELSARSIVLIFLSHAQTWEGETANAVKQKLTALLQNP
ncbi:hypothetical protein KTO58_05510 [Chitinophaga pendula]|uniref:hypothetical protein n=1 Tax=Chitinophaga TaxID=79328 RepID=UPI000BAFE1D4|nr:MULTISPECIES: hypothetical protein [Chitinophaga]ASZ15087.1 hypothetical protein CK934_23665 [Chitinophaga sp. MD30]UCJ08644.1 hypothetical protein KTO58_05510 [Chitinophaga pendula]